MLRLAANSSVTPEFLPAGRQGVQHGAPLVCRFGSHYFSMGEGSQEKGKPEARIKELNENWRRALADYKNLERRVQEERMAFVKFANLMLLSRLFEVYDSLKLALEHNGEFAKPILEQVGKILEEEGVGVVKIEVGEGFDHERMEAVEGSTGNKVAKVVSDGFAIDAKVVRPARVELQ